MPQEIPENELQGLLDFLRGVEPLKQTLRSGFTSNGRQESTAEHSWRLCLMAILLEKHWPDIDLLKLLKICLIHDLGEAVHGDIPAIHQQPGQDKSLQEREDLQLLLLPLPEALQAELLGLWEEYEQAATPEAKLAKALDKLETVLQHTQGQNPPDFDYGFNLSYGQQYTAAVPVTRHLRALVDADTRQLASQNGTLPAQPHVLFSSPRLDFRCWQSNDLLLAMLLWQDPEVNRFIGGPLDQAGVVARLADAIAMAEAYGVQYWPLFLRENGKFLGCGGLRPYDLENGVYEFGVHLLPSAWGQGYATEVGKAVMAYAFESLQAKGLFAGHHPENRGSEQMLLKLGFVYSHDELYTPTGLMHPSYQAWSVSGA